MEEGEEEFGSVCQVGEGEESGSVCQVGEGGEEFGSVPIVRWEREGRSLGQSQLEEVQNGSSVHSGLELFSGRMTSICLVFCRRDCQLQSLFLALHLLHNGVGRYLEFLRRHGPSGTCTTPPARLFSLTIVVLATLGSP